MKIVDKLKQHGIKGSFDILINYKMEPLLGKAARRILSVHKMEDVIILLSHDDFDMNAGAFYEYLLANEINRKFRIVWFVNHYKKRTLPNNVIQAKTKGINLKRYYYNAIAKYIFYDDMAVYKSRKGQKSIYFGHATRAMKNCRGKIEIPKDVDLVCSSSEGNDSLMSEVYVCDSKKMWHVGFPVTDQLYKIWDELIKLEVKSGYNKVIIWMPTFRKSGYSAIRNDSESHSETGLALTDSYDAYQEIDEILRKKNTLLIIKFHPAQAMEEIHVKDTPNIRLLSPRRIKELDINTYKLLTQTDALISDYSSISFDYLLLNKPIAYVLSDYSEYKLGFAVENPKDYMPGEYIYSMDDMKRFINDVVTGKDAYKEERNKVRDAVAKYNDGHVCKRIVKNLSII